MPNQPDEVAPAIKADVPAVEETKPSLADQISNVTSGQDVKDLIDDGLDRLKEVTVDDAVETGKNLAVRLLRRVSRGFDEATRKD